MRACVVACGRQTQPFSLAILPIAQASPTESEDISSCLTCCIRSMLGGQDTASEHTMYRRWMCTCVQPKEGGTQLMTRYEGRRGCLNIGRNAHAGAHTECHT